ncbi:Hypothetical predicted protein, partial [Paramuricea clavata]
MGPDGIPVWVLKENADILPQPIADIINKSYSETHLPLSWKSADIVSIPKEKPVRDVNDYVVYCFVKPAVLKKEDPNQYGTIPNSSTMPS